MLTQHSLRVPRVLIPSPNANLQVLRDGVSVHVGDGVIHADPEVVLIGRRCSNDITHLKSKIRSLHTWPRNWESD